LKRLRIGIMGTRGIPNHYGGFEQFAQWLSLGLLQKGHEVYVYNSSHHPYKEKEWNDVKIIHRNDTEPSIGTAGQFIYDLNCINHARKMKYDILLHLGYTSDAIWYWRWPKQTIHIMNMDGLEWKRSKYNAPTKRFLKWSERIAATKADLLVADSIGIRDHLCNTYGKKASFISYGAVRFTTPDPDILKALGLAPSQYLLLIARMEPENNIEMIIRGYLGSGFTGPLVVIGSMDNKYGKYIRQSFDHPSIIYPGAIYDQPAVDNLRYYSQLYFHGHSVGGTNPSLLEAMACGCRIAAHDNIFNKAILETEADYFSTEEDISGIIQHSLSDEENKRRKQINFEKLEEVYHPQKIVNAYEELFFEALSRQS
jgi:glycosyltransferase involved in cell wall biosynthesis